MIRLWSFFAFIPRAHKLLIAGLLLVAAVAFVLFVRSWLQARSHARQEAEREYLERQVQLAERDSGHHLSFTRGLSRRSQIETRRWEEPRWEQSRLEGLPWGDEQPSPGNRLPAPEDRQENGGEGG
jgi:hypothetical protein